MKNSFATLWLRERLMVLPGSDAEEYSVQSAVERALYTQMKDVSRLTWHHKTKFTHLSANQWQWHLYVE